MRRPSTRVRGTIAPPKTKIFVALTERDAAEKFSAVVVPFSAGQLAQASRRSKETAKGWKNGRAFPNGASLINLARQLPSVRAWLYSEIERGAEGGFDSPQMLNALTTMLGRLSTMKGPEGDIVRRAMSGAPGFGDE